MAKGVVGDVPNAPFRERFLQLQERGVSTSEIARRLGWHLRYHPADINRVKRVLGLMQKTNGHGSHVEQKMVTVETARQLCEALDMDPHEAGL